MKFLEFLGKPLFHVGRVGFSPAEIIGWLIGATIVLVLTH